MYDDAHEVDATSPISRRALIGGLGAAGAAVGLASLASSQVASAAPGSVPEAITPAITGLAYLGLDAYAFDVATTNPSQRRIYQTITGVQPLIAANSVFASLPIPAGSIVKQLNISYQGQPIPHIARRVLGSGTLEEVTPPTTTPNLGGGPQAHTFPVDAPIASGATYSVEVFCSAGDSVLGVEVGYIPPPQAFVPYTGSTPRVLDTRVAGGAFVPNEERVIDLSGTLIASGRAAVVNVTATETGGPGFLALFADGIAYPGNSSVNFTTGGQTIANSAIVTMTAGKIKVRCGPAPTHVIIDVVGTLL
jgi:hypothetical protein